MKFQIIFLVITFFVAVTADTLLRSQPLKGAAKNGGHSGVKGSQKPMTIERFRELMKAHKKKMQQKAIDKDANSKKGAVKNHPIPAVQNKKIQPKAIVVFDEDSDQKSGSDFLAGRKDRKHVAKRDTLLRSLPVKHREDKTKLTVFFKSGEAKRVAKRDTLLRSLPVKHREDKTKLTVFFKSGEAKRVAKRDTLLKSLPVNSQKKSAGINGDKRPVQHDAFLNALRERYNHKKNIAKRDTLLRSLPTANKGSGEAGQNKAQLDARRREAIRNFLKNRKAFAHRGTRNGKNSHPPAFPRKKRDIAATVVGAAVNSVVSNLMKNVEESVVKAENDVEAAKKLHDVPDSAQGEILGSGEIAPISNEVVALPFGPRQPNGPVANEAVPLPFAPVKAHDAPVANEIAPKPFAPVHADVEVIGGTNASTTTTSSPAGEKKGFFSTLFNSFKLFFGTVTNSVGGFFIDMGSRITNFVEKRIKV